MFLATTAIKDFWAKEEKIVFLGEWCKLEKDEKIWSQIDHETLPYHWDDRSKLRRDFIYLNKLYEKVLFQLYLLLNEIHNENKSIKYWRIILGPWLYSFIQILFDRYCCIKVAEQSKKITSTVIAKFDERCLAPKNFEMFLNYYVKDSYNFSLFSLLIESMGVMPFEYCDKNQNSFCFKGIKANQKSIRNKIFDKIINKYNNFVPDNYHKIVFVSSHIRVHDLAKLQLSLGQFPYIFPTKIKKTSKTFKKSFRALIKLKNHENQFEAILFQNIPWSIPLNYLEGYKEVKNISLKKYPNKPKLIFTANAHDSNDNFKFYAANHSEKGVELIGAQHGGHYGTSWSSADEHELRIFDKYYTWGWTSKKYPKTIPLPSVQLGIPKKSYKKKNQILLMHLQLPRYAYHLYGGPVSALVNFNILMTSAPPTFKPPIIFCSIWESNY